MAKSCPLTACLAIGPPWLPTAAWPLTLRHFRRELLTVELNFIAPKPTDQRGRRRPEARPSMGLLPWVPRWLSLSATALFSALR